MSPDPIAEAEAIADWKAGDILAGGRLLKMHEGLIRSIARRHVTTLCELDDLLQIGRLTLLRTAIEHDPMRARLATFAFHRLNNRVQDYARHCRYAVNVSDFAHRKGARPHAARLDAPIGEADGTLHDVLAAPEREEPTGLDVWTLVDALPASEAHVLRLLYGTSPQTMPEIGAALGTSKQAVHATKERALDRLRAAVIKGAQSIRKVKRNTAIAATRERDGVVALTCTLCEGTCPGRHNRRTCPLRQAA